MHIARTLSLALAVAAFGACGTDSTLTWTGLPDTDVDTSRHDADRVTDDVAPSRSRCPVVAWTSTRWVIDGRSRLPHQGVPSAHLQHRSRDSVADAQEVWDV